MSISAAIVMQRFRVRCFATLARWRACCVAFALGVAAFSSAPACAAVFSFNTTALVGTSARLEFSLFDGDFDLGNNIVTIASVNTNGSLGAFDCSLGCTGGPPFAITEAIGLGQYLQDLTLGTVFSFDLSFTTNFSGVNAPDRLVVSLLDAGTNFTLVDTDLDFLSDAVPAQDAILVVDLIPGSTPQLPTASNPPLPGAIPAPGTAALIVIGLVLLAARRTRTPVPAV